MTGHSNQAAAFSFRPDAGASPSEALTRSSRALAQGLIFAAGRVLGWLKICREYHKAAAAYEELRGLSNSELARRGLLRTTLAWDLCEACGSRPPN